MLQPVPPAAGPAQVLRAGVVTPYLILAWAVWAGLLPITAVWGAALLSILPGRSFMAFAQVRLRCAACHQSALSADLGQGPSHLWHKETAVALLLTFCANCRRVKGDGRSLR
jgi:hypothetical protein